jgi:hypothetical protein
VCPGDLVALDTSIDAELKPAKLRERIREGCRDVGSRFAVQRFRLD